MAKSDKMRLSAAYRLSVARFEAALGATEPV